MLRTALSNYRSLRAPRASSRSQPARAPRNIDFNRVVGARGPSWWSGYGTTPSLPGASAPAPTPAPAPAAPAAAASVPTGILPVDPSYDQTLASLARRRDDTLASLTQGRVSGLLDYGYQENPQGQVSIDPSNPYSRASLLQRNYDQSRAGTTTGMANAGQLYSGALINAQDANTQRFQQGSDSLQKAMLAFLSRNTQAAAGARTAFEDAAAQAMADRVARAADNPLYDPAALAVPAAASAAAGAPVGTGAPAAAALPPGLSIGRVFAPWLAASRAPSGRSASLPHRVTTRRPRNRTRP